MEHAQFCISRGRLLRGKIFGFTQNMPAPKAISLFSGCGGSDHALQKLGYNIVWANDIWQTACDTPTKRKHKRFKYRMPGTFATSPGFQVLTF